MSTPTLCERLGFDADTRAVIINADDFGMCHAENEATAEGLAARIYSSSTVMVPCPWFTAAAAFGREHPEADIGVHLTHTSEWEHYRWGPVSRAGVSSLVDGRGYFLRDVAPVYAQANLEDIEREARAQIDTALAAGIDVTHLDSHMGVLQLEARHHLLYLRLAVDYGLPIRMVSRRMLRNMGMDEVVAAADRLGVVAPDALHIGGPPAPEDTGAYWTALLRGLRPGVTEIYVHAALDHPELRAADPRWRQRVADHLFFMAGAVRRLLADLGIELIGYRALRNIAPRAP